ncbi:FTR1 family protein [Pseudanabaenaceae cyanobacterium LEGE 13415]|nr:FTR1 family protein [Pseudanabaenaceae cyanobacterium LEGE 13415]
MLATFLIMFREGVEAALIVGIIASYLRQTGRTRLMKYIWVGILLATLMCLAVALILQFTSQEFPVQQQELFASIIAFIAVSVLTWMVFWMRRAARSIKGELQSQVEAAIQSSDRTGIALIGMAFLAVAREGLETVVFLMATFQQNVGIGAPIGAFLGYAAAIAVGYGIYLGGVRLNLRQFFRWTGAFIILVAAGLMASAVRAAHEAGVWNLLQDLAFDSSNVIPIHSVIGATLAGILGYNDTPSVSELVAYFGYLVPTMALFLLGGNRKPSTAARPS